MVLITLDAAMAETPQTAVEVLLNDRQVAGLLGVSRRTLRSWRTLGAQSPIPFVKVGRAIRYRPSDVASLAARVR